MHFSLIFFFSFLFFVSLNVTVAIRSEGRLVCFQVWLGFVIIDRSLTQTSETISKRKCI